MATSAVKEKNMHPQNFYDPVSLFLIFSREGEKRHSDPQTQKPQVEEGASR
jgi:hypothetical protein